jgi:mono/diheme cytochrome c family protein
MKTFLAVILFSLANIAFFAGFSNFGIPQVTPDPPPAEEKLDLSAMTMPRFIALGERVAEGKGTCALCHNAVGGRAPLLEQAATVAKERIADVRYQGEATDVEGYLRESMVDPSAYVVPGFGKAGSDDKISPMPNMASGSIGLSEAEIAAVIAYLQSSGGVEVTVAIPSDAEPAEEESGAAEAEQRPVFENVEDAIVELGCGACHKVAGEEGDLGPDLTLIGRRVDRDYLRRSILNPNAELAQGFDSDLMPDDYGEQLYAVELELLVDYLAGLK